MSGVEQQPGVVTGLVPGEDLQPPAGGFLQTLEKVEELFGQSFVFQRLCRTLCQCSYLIFVTGATGGARVNFFWPA